MRFHHTKLIAMAATLCATSFADTFTNASQALEVFQQPGIDFRTSRQARNYLKEHPEESIDPLLAIVKSKGQKWQSCGSILVQTKNEKVLFTYIDLLSECLLENMEESAQDLSPPRGVNYGAQIAEYLGKMEDKRAVPVLKKAVAKGDFQVRRSAIEALYYLNDISMDRLFEMGKEEKYPSSSHVILSIAHKDMHSDPAYILSVLDRFIDSFPEQKQNLGLAHMYKMECYVKLGRHEPALREADLALEFPEIDYLFEYIGKCKQRISAEKK